MILLTAYNKLDILKTTLKSLYQCKGIENTEVYIYLDYGGNPQVRHFLERIVLLHNKMHLIKRSYNYGMVKNTLDGIYELFDKYEKLIVLSDDIEFSKDFLEFMNWALNEYEDDESIMFVTGYSHLNNKPLFKSQLITECLGIWKSKFPFRYSDHSKCIKDKDLMKKFGRICDMFPDLLKCSVYGINQSWMVKLGFEMFIKGKYQLFSGKNKVRFNITNSENCKAKEDKNYNKQLNEGWIVPSELKVLNLNYLYKWSKFKKLRRFIKQMFYKLKY